MEEKLKIVTIGGYQNSVLENYFKDNQNIEFLELGLNENIEKLNNKISNQDVIFLRSNGENLEKTLEVGKKLKEKEIITITVLEEKIVIENKEILENTINAIFPVTKKDDIENLFLELLKMIENIISKTCFIVLDFEDIKSILKDSGISIFGTLNINEKNLEKELAKNINYPFYNKSLKDSKKILIHLDALQDIGMAESRIIIDFLMNETKNKMKDVIFSIRINNNLKNRIECSFIAGVFREKKEKIKVNKEVVDDRTEDIFKVLEKFFRK